MRNYRLKNINPHALRRGFAKKLLEKGANITLTSKALGYCDIAVIMRCLYLEKEEVGGKFTEFLVNKKEHLGVQTVKTRAQENFQLGFEIASIVIVLLYVVIIFYTFISLRIYIVDFANNYLGNLDLKFRIQMLIS
ncbi:hypothetical protein M3215_15450 [Bacillus cytotoxicus]|uniref:Uncharacterized protein n=1 Tax=Bacillus cytotoxicus TaxID=580165 RepID=A0ACC6A8D1_9BACI|nr:hypothetical protein [Bacillus cytotoxicus]